MAESGDASAQKRAAILAAATNVFARYGFKKTSMDDLARAAGLSRQGLYLYFATKDVLFKAVVLHVIEATNGACKAALAREDANVEERLLGAFEAMHAHLIGHAGAEHMNELMATASQLLGAEFKDLEQTFVADISRVLKSGGIAERWKSAAVSAKELAQHLSAASHGVKQKAGSVTEYRDAMKVAVKIVCRGGRG